VVEDGVRCAVCGVRGVVKAVTSLPLVDGRFTNAKALRKSSCAVGAYRNLGSYGRRGACVFVQGDHLDKAPGWTAEVMHRLSINCRMTSLAMNSGYRFESMQSSGMRQLALRGVNIRHIRNLKLTSYTDQEADLPNSGRSQVRNLQLHRGFLQSCSAP